MQKHNILIVGGGGREHTIAHTLFKSPLVGKIYAAPGNGGIAMMKNTQCVPIKATDTQKILDFVKSHPDIYMTVVSTDDALAAGLVDLLSKNGFRAFGPTAAAAQIEASKAYSKEFMQKYKIPTAAFKVFDNQESALEYLNNQKMPIVIKADGLALGKGVLICSSLKEAQDAVKAVMGDKKFGAAGERVVIEQFVKGYEVTILAFTDGVTLKPMVTSRDYKRAYDNDKGLNTGGMGTFSPLPQFEPLLSKAYQQIFMPTIKGLEAEGRIFKGVLYFDLMVDGDEFNVIEYNARFGDPETQVVLPRLKTDLFTIFEAIIDTKLDKIDIQWDKSPRVCVIAASSGYPESYETGKEIKIGALKKDTLIFYAGAKLEGDKLYTSGGRVLGVVCKGKDLAEARENSYKEIEKIEFEGMYFRRDICKGFN